MKRLILVPSNGPEDWRSLLADPDKHWRDGHSAKSVATHWETAGGLPTDIRHMFANAGLGATELLFACPEWTTALPGGRRASQSDVFALVRSNAGVIALCVEAKVAESFGPTIDEWQTTETSGRAERLTFIKSTLGLKTEIDGALRYQLLHRTASAAIEASRFGASGAAMVVQSFSPDRMWLSDFQAFCRALGARESAGVWRHDLPSGRPLILGWSSPA